jgi:hypothetical protein
MLHMLQCLYRHVSIVYFKCFICFRRMLQMFHLNFKKLIGVLHGTTGDWRTTACCGRLSLLLLGRSRGSTHVGFPVRAHGGRGGAGPTTDASVRRYVGRGAWGLRPDITSRPNVRVLGSSCNGQTDDTSAQARL